MKDLVNPPEEYKEAYEKLQDFYDSYFELTNLVISPTGSLSSYTNAILTKPTLPHRMHTKPCKDILTKNNFIIFKAVHMYRLFKLQIFFFKSIPRHRFIEQISLCPHRSPFLSKYHIPFFIFDASATTEIL